MKKQKLTLNVLYEVADKVFVMVIIKEPKPSYQFINKRIAIEKPR